MNLNKDLEEAGEEYIVSSKFDVIKSPKAVVKNEKDVREVTSFRNFFQAGQNDRDNQLPILNKKIRIPHKAFEQNTIVKFNRESSKNLDTFINLGQVRKNANEDRDNDTSKNRIH